MKYLVSLLTLALFISCQRSSKEDVLNKSSYASDLNYILSKDSTYNQIDAAYVIDYTESNISTLEGKRYQTIISMAIEEKRKELTRESVRMLFDGLRFYEAMNTLPVNGELSYGDMPIYKCLEEKGFFRIENSPATRPSFKLVALEDINKYIIYENDYGDLVLKLGDFDFSIENITEPANRGDGIIVSYVTIIFTYQFNELGDCFASKRGNGYSQKPSTATLRLYDSGWAIEEIKNKPWWYRLQPNTKTLAIKSFTSMTTEYNQKDKSLPLNQRIKPEWFIGSWYNGSDVCLKISQNNQKYTASYTWCYPDDIPERTVFILENGTLVNNDEGVQIKILDYNAIVVKYVKDNNEVKYTRE